MTNNWTASARHNGSVNMLLADGHVEVLNNPGKAQYPSFNWVWSHDQDL